MLPISLLAAGLGAAVFALVADARAGWHEWATMLGSVLTALSWLLPGWLVAQRRPDLPFGWLLLAGGLCLSVGAAGTYYGAAAVVEGWSGAAWAGWFGGWVFFPHLGCQEAIYLFFPSARLPSPKWRRVVAAIVAVNALMLLSAALGTGKLATSGPLSQLSTPIGGLALFDAIFPLTAAAQNVLNLIGMSVIFRRWRQATTKSTDRRVLAVVLALGVVDAAVGVLLIAPVGAWIFLLAVPSTMGLTLALAWGVLRHQLWDVRLVVRRTTTWLLLTTILVAILTSGVALGGRTLGLIAASAIVTIVVAPLERRLRRLVDHLFFGERADPYTVLSTLGAELEASGDPGDALDRLVETIRTSLKVSYSAVELDDRDGVPSVAASAGTKPDTVLRMAVRHQGRDMGSLVVGQQAGDRPFTVSERKLLDDLARQVGAAASSVALTSALQQSRQRLVSAREEERRRLRSELHDGVASALTAIGLKVESAALLAPTDGARTQGILEAVHSDVSATLNEVRRVVTDLRPPALDDLGLFGALRQLATRFDSAGLHVELDVDDGDPAPSDGDDGDPAPSDRAPSDRAPSDPAPSDRAPSDPAPSDPARGDRLPAAVELAIYRIANEALQNVARHAAASSCHLALSVEPAGVHLSVEDNGNGNIATSNGATPGPPHGLGLPGMMERADELGGSVTVGRRTDGQRGSFVTAWLPR